MLKNKSKLILTILIAIIMLFTCSACFAVDEPVISTTDANAESTALVPEQEGQNSSTSNASPLESDLYLLDGSDVTIDYVVDGNAYIIADTVTITSQIGGDAFIIANTINIDGGYVYSNLFATASNININGIVYDLYSCADSITVGESGYIYRDAHTLANNFNIFGAIGRNVNTACTNISFTQGDSSSHGTIYGSLQYSSEKEVTIDESYVEGNITFNKEIPTQTATTVQDYLYSVATFVVTALAIYLLAIWLAPKFTKASKELVSKKILPVIGFGLLGVIIFPMITILLMMLGVSVKLAFVLLALYVTLLLIASAFFVIAISELVSEKLKLEGIWKKIGIVTCMAVILWAIKLIPYVGPFISFVAVVLGSGIIIKYIIPTNTKKQETEITTDEK